MFSNLQLDREMNLKRKANDACYDLGRLFSCDPGTGSDQ